MASQDLNVMSRETTGKEEAGRMRRAGRVPAVLYGHGEEPRKLSVNDKEMRDLMAHGHSRGLLNLKAEGGKAMPAIIKSVQRHPATHALTSIDFINVSLRETVQATVPIVLEGEPIGVTQDDGILVQAMHELLIESLPQNLPENISVDVSGLEFQGAPIHVREMTMPEGVTAITDGDEPVAVVNAPDVEPIVEEPMTAEEIEAAEAEGVNPMMNSEEGKEDVTTGDKSDTGEKPGKAD